MDEDAPERAVDSGSRKLAERAVDSGSRKLAERVAVQLEEMIVDRGWPVGEVLGSEPDLLATLGVSRAVFREAVRLLEHHSVAKMRRGPGGGLVVTSPDTRSVVRAAALKLKYDDASNQDIFEARMALELKIVELAADRIDENGIARLRQTLEEERRTQDEAHRLGSHDIHLVIADLTENPAMRLFLDVLTQLTIPRRSDTSDEQQARARNVRHAHERIVEAIVAGDVALARYRMQSHLNAMGNFIIGQADAGEPTRSENGSTPTTR
ncbi:FadR/GntR family transcriptional regulator [Rhodococcus opacus]|uniref:FadR/GntR family transcriptional regulator n=1 Tax=Rhodococcus opacus TaxID=37919 RepID=UPI0018E3FE69|nr:FCD domain-containing protein [Rhodococcus opacus]